MKIGLIVDNPYRDLPGMVLLARELAHKGARCYLIPYNLRDAEVWSLAPDFLLLNFLRKVNEDWTKSLAEARLLFGVLDTEGSVFSPIPAWAVEDLAEAKHIICRDQDTIIDYLVTCARNSETRKKAACYFAWAKSVREFLIDNRLYSVDQVKVTGSPKTDLLTPVLRAASRAISPYADNYDGKPLVLINASFPTANPAFLTSQQEVDLMVKAFKYNRKFCEESVRTQAIALKGFARMANELARSFPQVTFIFRPHPFESLNIYNFVLDDLPNLVLKKQGTVDGWLLRSSALIQLGSSTAVEASVLGVPVFAPGWLPMHVPVPVSNLASVLARNIEEMKEYLNSVFKGEYQVSLEKKTEIEKAIEQSYGTIDGKAHKRVAEEILKVCQSANSAPNFKECFKKLHFTLIAGRKTYKRFHYAASVLWGRGIHWSWRKLRNSWNKNLPWDGSEKKFDAVQVQQILKALDQVQPSSGKKTRAAQAMPNDYRFGYREGRSVIVEAI